MSNWRTTCPYCGVACGVVAAAGDGGTISIAGDVDHPANRGRLCVKGATLGETLGRPGRLLRPRFRGTELGLGWSCLLPASGEIACRGIFAGCPVPAHASVGQVMQGSGLRGYN